MSSPSSLFPLVRHVGALAFGFALVACNGSSSAGDLGGDTPNTDTAAGYLYLGACTPSVCNDLPVAEIGCASGQPEYVCSARSNGQCAIDVRCPSSSPDDTVSFAPCEDSQCGPKPGNPAEACPSGYEWTGSQCGSLNGAACAWANGCYPPKEPLTVDQSKIGKACGLDVSCDAPESCVTLPRESGVEGAHCIADPCAAISCPTDRCMILESYPGQVRCE